jgi:hypothetical protein
MVKWDGLYGIIKPLSGLWGLKTYNKENGQNL